MVAQAEELLIVDAKIINLSTRITQLEAQGSVREATKLRALMALLTEKQATLREAVGSAADVRMPCCLRVVPI